MRLGRWLLRNKVNSNWKRRHTSAEPSLMVTVANLNFIDIRCGETKSKKKKRSRVCPSRCANLKNACFRHPYRYREIFYLAVFSEKIPFVYGYTVCLSFTVCDILRFEVFFIYFNGGFVFFTFVVYRILRLSHMAYDRPSNWLSTKWEDVAGIF